MGYCLKAIEANKAANPWVKEADLVFFVNPEKSLYLLNQIDRLKIPTIGIVNPKSNLVMPLKSLAKPKLIYPIVGSNSLNFIRIVLNHFTSVLNKATM